MTDKPIDIDEFQDDLSADPENARQHIEAHGYNWPQACQEAREALDKIEAEEGEGVSICQAPE